MDNMLFFNLFIQSSIDMVESFLKYSWIQSFFSWPLIVFIKWACLQGFANNTGADQPAHQRSMISTYVVRFLESFICKLATGEISIF